jgi:hypothetical protein
LDRKGALHPRMLAIVPPREVAREGLGVIPGARESAKTDA